MADKSKSFASGGVIPPGNTYVGQSYVFHAHEGKETFIPCAPSSINPTNAPDAPDRPKVVVTRAEREMILSLYPGLGRALDAARLVLRRRSARILAERRHVEQGGPAGPYNTALAREDRAVAALAEALRQWRGPDA